MPEKFLVTRHSLEAEEWGPESKEYPGLSEKGVELAQERAKEISEIIEKSDPGTIVFVSGISTRIRTRSTATIYGEALKETYKDREDVLVFDKKDLEEKFRKGKGIKSTIEKIAKEIKENPDKKIVLTYPLFLRNFLTDRWSDKQGNFNKVATKLLKRNNYDKDDVIRDWFKHRTNINGLKAPDPKEVAKDYLEGLRRLKEFVKKQVPDRPIIIGAVGHGWDIDALVTYLANKGEISLEGFEKVRGKMVKETELAEIEVKEDKMKLYYRGLEFEEFRE